PSHIDQLLPTKTPLTSVQLLGRSSSFSRVPFHVLIMVLILRLFFSKSWVCHVAVNFEAIVHHLIPLVPYFFGCEGIVFISITLSQRNFQIKCADSDI
ncbi:hypothetical protein L208DRAFT_1471834, partial [Tricholoma matsutake]